VNRVLLILGIGVVAFAAVMVLVGDRLGGPKWGIAVAILGIGLITVSRKR
jgi:hypothetical protein